MASQQLDSAVATSKRQCQCALFLARKGRHCRMQASKDSLYCGEHLTLDEKMAVAGTRRIPCPLDSSHSVFEHLLNKHLKKCNAAKKPTPVCDFFPSIVFYTKRSENCVFDILLHISGINCPTVMLQSCYVKNINSGLIDYSKSPEEQLPLKEFSCERIEELIKRINQVYEECQEEIESIIHFHPVVVGEIANSKNGPSAHKHLLQQASILGHMESANLLSSDTCYVEFGAGRGKLSHWLQLALSCENNVHYVLVDRASVRRKMDLYHRFDEQGPKFERLLIDIEHLDLSSLHSVCSGKYSNLVGVSKHLCGSATDLTLRCLVRLHQFSKVDFLPPLHSQTSTSSHSQVKRKCLESTSPDHIQPSMIAPSPSSIPLVKGIIIALCCHHCCDWKQFVGQEFFTEWGFTSTDFYILTHMSSLGVCGVRPDSKTNTQGHSALIDTLPSLSTETGIDESSPSAAAVLTSFVSTSSATPSTISESGLLFPSQIPTKYIPHPKELIGLKCKRLLDIARLKYLRANGYSAKLVYYVDRSVSLENVLLLAIPQVTC